MTIAPVVLVFSNGVRLKADLTVSATAPAADPMAGMAGMDHAGH